jgi:predicted RNase H-like nuclease (RuvC/YqgF family)
LCRQGRAPEQAKAEREEVQDAHTGIIPACRCNILGMIEDLQILEDRLKAVASLVERLRSENQSLRASLTMSEATVASLRQQMDDASQRIEALLKGNQS